MGVPKAPNLMAGNATKWAHSKFSYALGPYPPELEGSAGDNGIFGVSVQSGHGGDDCLQNKLLPYPYTGPGRGNTLVSASKIVVCKIRSSSSLCWRLYLGNVS